LSVGAEYNFIDPNDPSERSSSGLGNPGLSVKYVVFKSEAHETVLSLSFGAELGGVGEKSEGAESFTTISPALLFGKGFGDLPDAVGSSMNQAGRKSSSRWTE